MAKKDKKDIKQVIADALEHYHKMKPSIKDSTKRQNESLLSEFYRFVDTLPARDRTMKIFSQKGLNRYKEYLIDKMERSKTDGKKRNFGVGQLNRCGSMIARLINNVLKPEEVVPNHVDWMKVEDSRREDEYGHIPLLEDEVVALEQCTGLNDKENEYRNIFLLQIECGQRVSDMGKLLIGDYKIEHGKKYNYIVLSTTKENIKAYIPLTSKIKKQLKIIESHEIITSKYFNDNIKENNAYNEAIRRIAKKAKLDRIIVKTDSVGNVQERPLYETITSHDARCTFITNMLMSGVSYEILCKMTGHASDEMIKRVYAQLTEHQEIKRIESDLYSDIDENEVCEEHSQPVSEILKEFSHNIIHSHFEPNSSLLDSAEFKVFDNYIKSLNECVDSAIEEMCDRYKDEDEYAIVWDAFERNIENFGFDWKAKDSLLSFWPSFDTLLIKDTSDDPNFSRFELGRMRINYLCVFINILRKKEVGSDVITILEQTLHDICKEYPNAALDYLMTSMNPIRLPIIRFLMVSVRALLYIQENRPIANKFMLEDDGVPLKFMTDWNNVFNELQLIPLLRLETLIQNTHCQPEIKIAIYNSIKNGDYDGYIKAIIPNENNISVLIRHVNRTQYFRKVAHTLDSISKTNINDIDDPCEISDCINGYFDLNYPFIDDELMPDFLKQSSKEIDYKKGLLYILDIFLRLIGDFKKSALSSEIKILNKVLCLVDMSEHPELKEAYDEYKTKLVAQKNKIEEPNKAHTPNVNETFKDKSTSNSIQISSKRFDIDKLVELLTTEDDLNDNKVFVTLVETDLAGIDVFDSLKYFFGVPLGYRSYTLKWNGRNRVSLKFLIRLLGTMRDELTEENVIDTYKYDGISDLVETGKEPNWGPVAKVFNYKSIDSLQSADIGVEDDVKQRNLEEMRTIAKIVFACKK